VLGKAQEEMRRYTDRRRRAGEEYRTSNLVLLSTPDLKWQMRGRKLEKLTKCFVGLYKVKKVVSENAVELSLSTTVKIHPVVNFSRLQLYKLQVEEQKVTPSLLVIVEGEEEYEVEKILNKRRIQGKDKFLVCWKGYTAEADTWEERKNLENARKKVEEFEREYREEAEEVG